MWRLDEIEERNPGIENSCHLVVEILSYERVYGGAIQNRMAIDVESGALLLSLFKPDSCVPSAPHPSVVID